MVGNGDELSRHWKAVGMNQIDHSDTPKGRGRPSELGGRGSMVGAWVTTAEHDDLIQRAQRQGKSVSQYLRDLVRQGSRS